MLTKYVAVLFGCFVFLFANQLRGQDQLLKEYIYLDGRLLAVERRIVPAIAENRAIEEDKDLKTEFAAYSLINSDWRFVPADTHQTFIAHLEGPTAREWQPSANSWPIMMPDDLAASSAPYEQSMHGNSNARKFVASKAAGSVGMSDGGLDDSY